MTNYFAIIHHDADSAFGAYFPDLPGCFAAGDTIERVRANSQVSLRLYAECVAGDQIASPRSLDDLMRDAEVAECLASGGRIVAVSLIHR